MLVTILIILAILFFVGALPRWPYSRRWGYLPSSTLGVIIAVVVILLLLRVV